MKTVLITGASRGIGASIAIAFAQQGYAVVINYNKNKEKAENLAKVILDRYKVPVLAVKCDVSDYAQVENMFKTINDSFGGVDVLVNNAGVSSQMLFTDISAEDWQAMMGTNLNSVFYCSKLALPYMISKKALAKEVAPSNIRVNCVAPGVVMTDMMQNFDEETLKELTEETPLQKLGTPKNIADAVVFLASSKAEFITGQVLGVNGGFII